MGNAMLQQLLDRRIDHEYAIVRRLQFAGVGLMGLTLVPLAALSVTFMQRTDIENASTIGLLVAGLLACGVIYTMGRHVLKASTAHVDRLQSLENIAICTQFMPNKLKVRDVMFALYNEYIPAQDSKALRAAIRNMTADAVRDLGAGRASDPELDRAIRNMTVDATRDSSLDCSIDRGMASTLRDLDTDVATALGMYDEDDIDDDKDGDADAEPSEGYADEDADDEDTAVARPSVRREAVVLTAD